MVQVLVNNVCELLNETNTVANRNQRQLPKHREQTATTVLKNNVVAMEDLIATSVDNFVLPQGSLSNQNHR